MSSPPPSGSPLAQPEPWNLVAGAYAAELLDQFALFANDALDLTASKAGDRIVDVATGPGTLAVLAAERGVTVDALDFSAAMVAELQRRLREQPLPGITVREGDGQHLPYGDGQYDGGFSMFGLMFFPDRVRGLRELHRVLKPGGQAVISSWTQFEGPFALLMEAIRAEMPALPFGQGKGPLSEPEDIVSDMGQAGFATVTVHPRLHVVQAPSLADFWGGVERTMAPLVLLRRKLGEARWKEVAAGVVARLRAHLGDGPFDLELRALLGHARK
jgi:SAM-dependent methyltransferase